MYANYEFLIWIYNTITIVVQDFADVISKYKISFFMENRTKGKVMSFHGNETILLDLSLILLLMHLWETMLIIIPANCYGNTYISFLNFFYIDLFTNVFSSNFALDIRGWTGKQWVLKQLSSQVCFSCDYSLISRLKQYIIIRHQSL